MFVFGIGIFDVFDTFLHSILYICHNKFEIDTSLFGVAENHGFTKNRI